MTRPEVPQWCRDAAAEIEAIWTATLRPSIAAIIAKHAPQQPQPEASGVERFTAYVDYGSVGCEPYLVVTAADHDRVVREKDATIAELRANLRSAHHIFCNYATNPLGSAGCICVRSFKREQEELQNELIALRTRAEAAEAKCEEFRNALNATISAHKEDHASLTAKLAAVNERVAALTKERDGLWEALVSITQVRWGYDGDCGAVAIAEAALAALSQPKGGG